MSISCNCVCSENTNCLCTFGIKYKSCLVSFKSWTIRKKQIWSLVDMVVQQYQILPECGKVPLNNSFVRYVSQEKITDSQYWIFLGQLKKSHKNPKFGKVRQVPTREFQPSCLVGTCLTLPNLEFLWVFFKYPKISKNGNLQEPLLESVIFPVEADQVAGGRAWTCA